MGNKVKKMLKSQKHVFWQAFIACFLIFAFGILMGFLLENYRTNKMADIFAQSELTLLDARLQNEIYKLEEIDCENAIQENIRFADRVYEEAILLDKYEKGNKITERIVTQHKKYDLLRILFWFNSIKIKEACNASYHNVVYFYRYKKPDLEQKAKQTVMSNVLKDFKEKYGNEVMLIPIAADLNLSSVNILVKLYDVNVLPTVLIDEEIRIEELRSVKEIEELVHKESNRNKNIIVLNPR